MRALSLTQPWAMFCVWPRTHDESALVAEKEYETRSFGCSWARNPKPETIYIHAAQTFPRWARDLCWQNPFFFEALKRHGMIMKDLPLGAIVGQMNIVGSIATESIRDRLSPQEVAFGNYENGRLAIRLENPIYFDQFFPVKGALGLWRVPEDLHSTIQASIRK